MSAEPEDQAQASEADDDVLSQVLQRGVRFVMLRLEGIPGNRKVPGTKVMLGEKELDKAEFSDPTLRLLPPAWREKFNAIKNRAAQIIGRADPRKEEDDGEIVGENLDLVDIPGVSLVSAGKAEAVEAEIAALDQNEFRPLVTAFLAEYPQIVQAVRQLVNDASAWSVIERRVPSAKELQQRLRLRFTRVPITFLGEAGKAIAEATARRIILGITKGIEAEAARIRERVKEGGAFKSATFNGLKEKFQLLKDFSFLASPETLGKLKEAEQAFGELGDAAHVVLNQDMKSQEKVVIGGVNAALASLTREARKDAGGRFRRSIRV